MICTQNQIKGSLDYDHTNDDYQNWKFTFVDGASRALLHKDSKKSKTINKIKSSHLSDIRKSVLVKHDITVGYVYHRLIPKDADFCTSLYMSHWPCPQSIDRILQ